MKGEGLINNAINSLPFELHIPGYQFCGPGTRLQQRLAKGQRGINKLDNACMHHDIAYDNSTLLSDRHKADIQLINMAKQRIQSKDATKGEKIASWIVNKAMKTKVKLGAGIRNFKTLIRKMKSQLKKYKPKSNKAAINFMILAAKKLIPKDSKIKLPRVIPLPKTGGILPLIPIFAGLSALGSLAGGAAGIAKAVNSYQSVKNDLQESVRHNKMMESIALGRGLYLKPYKKGKGLCIKQSKN